MSDVQADSQQTTLSLEQLAEACGAPPAGLVDSLVQAQTKEQFMELGRKISSARVVTDCTRILGLGWQVWSNATPALRRQLRGVSQPLFAAAVNQALTVKRMMQTTQSTLTGSVSEKDVRATEARTVMTRGHALNDQAETVLKQVASRDPTLLKRVEGASGAAPDHLQLAARLRTKADLVAEWCASTEPAMQLKVQLAALDAEYAEDLRAMARRVEHTGNAAQAPVRRHLDQGQLDLQDGLALHLMYELVRAFEAAHELDSSIPRLVPIATRRALGLRLRKASVMPDTTPPDNNG